MALAGACTATTKPDNQLIPPSAPPAPPPIDLALTPSNHATRQPVSTEIGIKLSAGRITKVRLTRDGHAVKGSLRPDRSSWVPAEPLKYSSKYAATVTAASPGGRTATRTTSFATMSRPNKRVGTGLYLFSGQTYGVAMPIVIEFNPGVPASARARVQRRLFVSTTPNQPGVWHWEGSRQVWYRAPDHWKPGTRITVRSALGGLPMGGSRYGDSDRTASARIGGKVSMLVDNHSKQMSVYQNDKRVRRMPVSLGKRSTPSSSGRMVIMSKENSTIFDTTDEGPNGYRVRIAHAQRITWGGEFIHSAPWSVGDQGHRNVSHGCVNLSPHDARWLFGRTHVGDPVTVRGTSVKLAAGNGWTAWNESGSEYIKSSALPVPSTLARQHGSG